MSAIWGDNIIKIELINFIGINQVIDFKTDSYENSFRIGDDRYYSSMFLVDDEESPINPLEIFVLLFSSIDSDLSELGLFKFFNDSFSYVYVDFIDTGIEFNYMMKLNRNGIINERLFSKEGNVRSEVKFESLESNIGSSLLHDNMMWFSRLKYYSYITISADTFESDEYKTLKDFHFKNKEYWGSEYESYLLTILNLRRYGLTNIEFRKTGIRFYNNEDSHYLLLEEQDEHFINFFLLIGVVLDILSTNQGILLMSNCDMFDDLVIRLVFNWFNKCETNSLGSQLIFVGNDFVRNKITLDRKQIILPIKKSTK